MVYSNRNAGDQEIYQQRNGSGIGKALLGAALVGGGLYWISRQNP